jgi:hypothetical protein
MACALVCFFTAFFYPNYWWLMVVGFGFVFGALAVNIGVEREQPGAGFPTKH